MKKLVLLVLLMTCLAGVAMADMEVWTLVDESGRTLTQICYEPAAGDQYISGDNQLYEVVCVEGGRAVAAHRGDFALPDVSWLDGDTALPVSAAAAGRSIVMYCTHSDESYEPSDGTYSDAERGSIYEIAGALADALAEDGVDATVSDATHHPHDAGAYRRSRQTAVQLLKSLPDAVFDIHRDGIPDPDSYAAEIGGKKASKVRLLVGRGNQNMSVNRDFAAQIKAVADKVYPGLIKDIYMGKGTYNQDLAPKSLLFECGTYTLDKERVLTSMPMMADVVTRALYGGVVGSAGSRSSAGSASSGRENVTQGEPDPTPVQEDAKGAGVGIVWLIGLGVIGLVIFAFASKGSGGAAHKIGRNLSEMTGGLIGKKPRDGEPRA